MHTHTHNAVIATIARYLVIAVLQFVKRESARVRVTSFANANPTDAPHATYFIELLDVAEIYLHLRGN